MSSGPRPSTRTVLAAPYGDLDVAAALGNGMSSLYQLATSLSREAMQRAGVTASMPVVAPPSGVLPNSALQQTDPQAPVVLRSGVLPSAPGPVSRTPGVSPVVLADPRAEGGGPSPNSTFAALPVRQRLLSEAALHAMSADRGDPLVVSMPEYWNPGSAWETSRFFAALDTSWLRLVDLPTVVSAAPVRRRSQALEYPVSDAAAQLPKSNLVTSRELVATAGTYANLLVADGAAVERGLGRIALLGSSTTARDAPLRARMDTSRTTRYVRAKMARVRVEGPEFVMMSGEVGPIQVTLVNGLDQRVRVGLTVSTLGSDLSIDDVAPRTLAPRGRASVRLEARSSNIGVHSVTLTATNAKGVPVGPGTQFTVRTSNVSQVVWGVMAVGGGLLLVAIAIRLLRRIRRRRSTQSGRRTSGAGW